MAALSLMVAVVGAGLAGCTDDSPGADPTDDPSATSGSPTESSSPSVEPATGKTIDSPSFSFQAPEGWRTQAGRTTPILTTRYTGDQDSNGDVKAFLSTADGPALIDEPLAKLGREQIDKGAYERAPKVLDNIEVDGEEMYRLAGQVNEVRYVIAIGAIHNDNLVRVEIQTDSLSPEELEDVFDSILATWQWK